MKTNHEWAIVLAAGDGTRLSVLTDAEGAPVPKQYWSLQGSRSLLGDALQRAFAQVTPRRTVVVVAERHRAHWERELSELAPENVIVQPENRGTAAGLLLPLLAILERDPEARILVLPSDHFVDREYVLGSALRLALSSLGKDADRLVVLGISPSTPETGYGWIVPRPVNGSLDRVATFVEKPPVGRARALMQRGALWNSFLMAVRACTLLELFEERHAELVARVRAALASGRPGALKECYADLACADFSRDILQERAERLWVLRVPECGWTDLGTPERLAECLARLEARSLPAPATERRREPARFDLGAALRRLGRLEVPVPDAGAA